MRVVMFEIRDGLLYTKEHVWILVDGKNAKFGVTDYAQHETGEIVYVETPTLDTYVKKDEEIGAVESIKSVEPIYAPVTGTIIEVNDVLKDTPNVINQEPFDGGWIAVIEMDNLSEINDLENSEEYKKRINSSITSP